VRKDSPIGTFTVALVLCLVCSIAVATASVMLQPFQEKNAEQFMQRQILTVAGLLEEDKPVDVLFQQVEPRIVNLDTGEYAPEIDAATYDQRKAAKDPAASRPIPSGDDIAKIRRRANYAPVYRVRREGEPGLVILPVHGYGLWSTMYGVLALAEDGRTIKGITFYQQAETAGLGSEIENPNWQSQWKDKLAMDDQGQVRFELVKGGVTANDPDAQYHVDGLSGATLTADGVTNMIRYWLGEQGFGPYLARLSKEGDQT